MSKTRTKTVRIDRTRHKTQPYKITEIGTVDKERKERYVTERTACIGAVRACRDFLEKDIYNSRIKILLPNDRQMLGWFWYVDGSIMLSNITGTGKRKSKSTTKAKK